MRHKTLTTFSSLFLMLLISTAVSAEGEREKQPPQNPVLVAAIKVFQDHPSDAHWKALSRSLQSASYLIPIRNRGEEFVADQTGTITISAGVKLAFPAYRGANGLSYLPVHTDEAAIKAWLAEQDVDTLVLAAAQVWDLVLADEGWAGAFVNPGTQGMVLTRDALRRLKDDLKTK